MVDLSNRNVFRVWVAVEEFKTVITVENSFNPSSVYIRICKHRRNVFYCFHKKNFSEKKAKLFVDGTNYSPAAGGSTSVFNILTSFLWSIRVQTMENCCRFVYYN